MDLINNQKLLKGKNRSIISQEEDRVSKLPDSVIHYILSFIETKCVARTCVLSKRWNHIWSSIPILDFEFRCPSRTHSSLKINRFMDFVDRTLHLRDASSNIQRFSLNLNPNMNASRVHSWIENLTRRNIEDLSLSLHQDGPSSIPFSLFTCESLTQLELNVGSRIQFPKNISFPKLKSLTLNGVQFTDGRWNEQLFSNCLVLEELSLENCTWFGMRKFCIITPVLKILHIENDCLKEDGLGNCDLKIHAPSLVSLTYWGNVAKDYILSSFLALDSAEVDFFEDESRRQERINRAAVVSKFLRAISHVRCLTMFVRSLQEFSVSYNFINNLPTFHNLKSLSLIQGPATEKVIITLLKAAPNLKRLLFDEYVLWSSDDVYETGDTEGLFQHLQSVRFMEFIGEAMEMRCAELILRNAKCLQRMTIEFSTRNSNAKSIEVLSQLLSFPRASCRCVVIIV